MHVLAMRPYEKSTDGPLDAVSLIHNGMWLWLKKKIRRVLLRVERVVVGNLLGKQTKIIW